MLAVVSTSKHSVLLPAHGVNSTLSEMAMKRVDTFGKAIVGKARKMKKTLPKCRYSLKALENAAKRRPIRVKTRRVHPGRQPGITGRRRFIAPHRVCGKRLQAKLTYC